MSSSSPKQLSRLVVHGRMSRRDGCIACKGAKSQPYVRADLPLEGDPVAEHNQEWSWVAEDGTEHAVDESELTFALSSEELPPHILVHKSGWGQWLPAMQVAELQWALPAGRSDNARTPESGDKPAPPLAQYPGVKKRARDIARGKIDPASESALSLPNIRAQKATDSQPLAEIGRAHV